MAWPTPHEFQFYNIRIKSFFKNLAISTSIFLNIIYNFGPLNIFLILKHDDLYLFDWIILPKILTNIMKSADVMIIILSN